MSWEAMAFVVGKVEGVVLTAAVTGSAQWRKGGRGDS